MIQSLSGKLKEKSAGRLLKKVSSILKKEHKEDTTSLPLDIVILNWTPVTHMGRSNLKMKSA